MHTSYTRWALVLLLLCVVSLTPTRSTSTPAAPSAYPYQPGFPRTNLQGSFFSSPTVFDLYHNNRNVILTGDSAGCVWGFDANGNTLPGFPWYTNGNNNCNGGQRINNSLAVGDLDGNGWAEIVAGTRGNTSNGTFGKVWVWHWTGAVAAGWPKQMAWNWPSTGNQPEVYSVALANVTGNNNYEVLAGTSNESGDAVSLYAWNGNGSALPGFPNGYAPGHSAGIFGHIAAGDLSGDGSAEIIAGRDHIYTSAYEANGQFVAGWPQQTYLDQNKRVWGQDKYIEYTRSGPAVGDLDHDGAPEVVIAGKVRDPLAGWDHPQIGSALLVLNADGSRRAGWEVGKTVGAPLSTNYPPNNPVTLVDLNGDGDLEIVVTFDDGTIRAFRDDGLQLWTYNYAQGRRMFASEVVAGDITGDGVFELVFGTYAIDSSAYSAVGIEAITTNGQHLSGFPLHVTAENAGTSWGFQAAPTLADIDKDCRVEIVAHSRGGALYAWRTPGIADPAFLPWPTSRHDNTRRAEYVRPSPTTVQPPQLNGPFKLFFPLVRKGCR